jgi:small subunit ribosomal protein S6
MRRYESVVIIGSEMTDDDIRSFAERYSEIIKNGQGEVIKLDDWGVKKLAYLVKNQEKGRYVLFDYLGEAELVKELERRFRISEEVMKFITVKIADDVDPEELKAKMRQEREAQEEAAEARRAAREAQAKAEAEKAAQAQGEQTPEPPATEQTETPQPEEEAPKVEETPAAEASPEEKSETNGPEATEDKKEGGE